MQGARYAGGDSRARSVRGRQAFARRSTCTRFGGDSRHAAIGIHVTHAGGRAVPEITRDGREASKERVARPMTARTSDLDPPGPIDPVHSTRVAASFKYGTEALAMIGIAFGLIKWVGRNLRSLISDSGDGDRADRSHCCGRCLRPAPTHSSDRESYRPEQLAAMTPARASVPRDDGRPATGGNGCTGNHTSSDASRIDSSCSVAYPNGSSEACRRQRGCT